MRAKLGAVIYLAGLATCVFAAEQGLNTVTAVGFAAVVVGYVIANRDSLC